MNYYNEWDPQAAAWLRELIENKLIPEGVVDERSITEVQAKDLKGFTQCHFFAGIGGWPLALQLAGVESDQPLWTGSPPCQPFSAAGKQLGQYDPRHLAPVFLDLISQCRPPVLFGEQVAPAIGKSWMCDLQAHLEGEGYAVGFAVLPACGVGAPHKRDRLFFGAYNLADTSYGECEQQQDEQCAGIQHQNFAKTECGNRFSTDSSGLRSVAHTVREQRNRRGESGEQLNQEGWETAKRPGGLSGVSCELAYAAPGGRREKCENSGGFIIGDSEERWSPGCGTGGGDNPTDPNNGGWSDSDWLGCRDGKFRPVEPGTFPLANGIPARVGRLRGYGNAIVPQVAAEFIKAFMAAKAEAGV